MALSNEIAKAGGTPRSLQVTADVTLDLASGATITSSKLTVTGEVEGLDPAGVEAAAQAAKAGCPVSKALGAIEISLDIGSISGT
jgi:osmotically inducible protein OsmC